MLQLAFSRYINNFKGFSREIWILTLITFINRAGTMVLPFLSKYLKEDLHFSYSQVGWVMVCFGVGSMAGSWLGGKLSDKLGFYRVMIFSLFTSGIAFVLLQYITSFVGLCIGMFSIMIIADMFRPAMFVSLSAYAKPENRTRALTLVRLAINLGFAAGPAMGGLIIMSSGYKGLFWVDGITCIVAILIFSLLVKEKEKTSEHKDAIIETSNKSVFTDTPFWIFLFICMTSGILFFQLFTTIPLYHKVQFNLTEFQSGLLLMMNGLIIFFTEMAVVGYVERKQIDKVRIVGFGLFAMTVSMFLLLINTWSGILVVMMLFMTFGEMFAFPFSNSFAMSRAPKGHEGRYMAIFTMSYSLAHILSSKIGMEIIGRWGYQANWFFMGTLGLIALGFSIWLRKLLSQEND
ncbi:putative integral membrane transport protein [Flavobacterium saliperosum S13]|uniref:Predicted arabinose efflux permease, MFS family n=2 Tax=Flavobacterium saliperosum TaxID=329186 RepID=A0A1G4VF98_9FLAO|nr:MFS transporter [Flavobacterium saliperosum]ESU25680.1 putative integral membrane transport protein [Flavobacterium saliperosum S13]SCX05865.1 Predicted arabinose efflux permease, MFS family [Flavobacterium saliperosum]